MLTPLLQTPPIAPTPTVLLNIRILGGIVVVLWTIEIVDELILQGALNRFGIRPRQSRGLQGIILSPLLHGGFQHLSANTVPLVVMGGMILFLQNQMTFLIVTTVVWFISGIGTWLLGGPRTNHIGASGIVFGYLGFLLLQGYLERSPIAIGLAVFAGILYGSSLWGILPIKRGRSWQGHLFGCIGGGIAARYLPELTQATTTVMQQLQLIQSAN